MQPVDASRGDGISECPYIGAPVHLRGKPCCQLCEENCRICHQGAHVPVAGEKEKTQKV